MRALLGSLSLVLLLALGLRAQIDPVAEVNAAATALQSQTRAGLELSWTGRGLYSGNVFTLTLTNTSPSDMTVRLAAGQVVLPGDPATQKMILEGNGDGVLVRAGQSVTIPIRGYCLESDKQPPASGQSAGFTVAPDAAPYRQAVLTVREGLRLSLEGRLGTELKPEMQRMIVIQRALWAQEPVPYTRENLYEELQTELANSEKAEIAHAPSLSALVDGIWRDVMLTLTEVRKMP